MARLYRPHIPLSVRVKVVARQIRSINSVDGTLYGLGLQYERDFPGERGTPFFRKLGTLLSALAQYLGCDVKDLRLDHDPPLGARPRYRRGLSPKTFYKPDANNPDHLFYRPHGPEHAGSHLIKTNVRGDHGQHPDRVLIKKERRRERSRKCETPANSSRFPKTSSRRKPATDSAAEVSHPKWKWPKRPFAKRSKPR